MFIFLSLTVVGCTTINLNKTNEGSSTVVKSKDSKSKVDNIILNNNFVKNKDLKSKEKTIVKINSPGLVSIADSKKSVLLKQKLRKCGVKYVPWADRHANDLVLMPKILKVCKNLNKSLDAYVIHSTKKKRKEGYLVKNNLFIPYNWSEKDISSALNHPPVKKQPLQKKHNVPNRKPLF
jgi:hypothetical protein